MDCGARSFDTILVFVMQPPPGWTGGVGFVSADMIKAHLPAPAGDVKVSDWQPSLLILPRLWATRLYAVICQPFELKTN